MVTKALVQKCQQKWGIKRKDVLTIAFIVYTFQIDLSQSKKMCGLFIYVTQPLNPLIGYTYLRNNFQIKQNNKIKNKT